VRSYLRLSCTDDWVLANTCLPEGYGDVVPKSAVERYVAIVGMVLGASVFAYMMGAMSNVVANMNSNNAR
jgi:hypothetical protein